MSTQLNFQPLRLLMPDAAQVEQVIANVSDAETRIEFPFKLSGKPPGAWVNFFLKSWRFWYGNDNVPEIGFGYEWIVVKCLPSEISEARLMLVETIDEANRKSAPRARYEAGRIAAGISRRVKMAQLEAKQCEPIMLPHNHDGEVLANMIRQKNARDTRTLKAQIAQAEIRKAVEEMITDDLVDAVSRTEGA